MIVHGGGTKAAAVGSRGNPGVWLPTHKPDSFDDINIIDVSFKCIPIEGFGVGSHRSQA